MHSGHCEVSENGFGCNLQKGFRIKWNYDEWFKVVIKGKVRYDDDTFLEKSLGDENACYIIKEIETYHEWKLLFFSRSVEAKVIKLCAKEE